VARSIGPARSSNAIIAKTGIGVAAKCKKSLQKRHNGWHDARRTTHIAAPMLRYRWKSRPDIAELETQLDELRSTVVQLRHDLGNKQRHVGQLKVLLLQRTERIDELANVIAVLRSQNQRLDQECENLAQLVQLSPK
jgi:chromosome segregation ATPase